MTKNRFIEEYPMRESGITIVEHSGMAVEDFNTDAVGQLQKILTNHQMADKLAIVAYSHNVEEETYFYALIEGTAVPDIEGVHYYSDEDEYEAVLQKSDIFIQLNLDDEDGFTVSDDLIPPVFVRDLIILMAQVSGAETPSEQLISISRKGMQVCWDDSDTPPPWSAYEELLAL